MTPYCGDCPDKIFCSKLCKEAEEYADQDHIKLKERAVSTILFQKSRWPVSEDVREKLNPREKAVLSMFAAGMSRNEIRKALRISRRLLTDYIYRARRKMR